jgi:hypothetical protein
MHKPYTYLIGWPERNLWYYGVRFAKRCDPLDLWSRYFTSSIHVHKQRELGEPSVIQVRRVFETSEAARSWELRVLRRMRVKGDPRFLNRSEIAARPAEKHPSHVEAIAAKLRGQKRSPEQRAKMGRNGATWKLSEETKRRQSLAKKGVPKPPGFGAKVSKLMTGRKQSEQTRLKRKASLTGKKKSPEHVAKVVEAKRINRLAREAQKSK